jgi:hypothetical protein
MYLQKPKRPIIWDIGWHEPSITLGFTLWMLDPLFKTFLLMLWYIWCWHAAEFVCLSFQLCLHFLRTLLPPCLFLWLYVVQLYRGIRAANSTLTVLIHYYACTLKMPDPVLLSIVQSLLPPCDPSYWLCSLLLAGPAAAASCSHS